MMKERKLDALMVTGDLSASMNYRYLSGHLPRDYQSNFSRPHIMILANDGNASIVTYCLIEKDARASSWVKNIRSYTQPFSYKPIHEAIEEMGLTKGKFGSELGLDQRMMMPIAEFDNLRKALPRAEFLDASDLLWSLRMVKSPLEAETISKADEVNGRALERLFSSISVGMTEIDAVKKLVSYIVEEGAYRPPHSQVIINSGPDWRLGFIPPKDKRLEKGDLIFVDCGSIYNGYWGEFNRMAVMGKPSDRMTRNHDMIRKIVGKIIDESLKAGVKASDVIRFTINLYKEMGLDSSQYKIYLEFPYLHIAHGIGLNSSEPPFVRIDSDKPIPAGCVLSVEAYILDKELYGTEEDVYVSDDGCKVLSPRDKGLYLI